MNLREQALNAGYVLTPVSETVIGTFRLLLAGLDRASRIADRRGIQRTAASQRLRALVDIGVAEEHGTEGKEKLFRPTLAGLGCEWSGTRCSMCDAWYDPVTEAAEHAHVLPQSGPLRERWIASGLSWADFHDHDSAARKFGHRDALS